MSLIPKQLMDHFCKSPWTEVWSLHFSHIFTVWFKSTQTTKTVTVQQIKDRTVPDQFLVLRSSCSDLWVKDVASPSCNSLSTQPEPILVITLYFLPQKNLNPSFCIKRYKLASTQKTCTLFIDKLVLAWIMKKSAYNEAFHVIFTSTLTQIARNEKTCQISFQHQKANRRKCYMAVMCRHYYL